MPSTNTFSFLQISKPRLDGSLMHRLNLPRELRVLREEEIIKVFRKAIFEGGKRGVDAVFILGELWDRAAVSRDTVRATITFLSSFKDMPIYIVPGRSDAFTPDSPYCAEFLRAIELPRFGKNVHIFEAEEFITLQHPVKEDVLITARSFSDQTRANERAPSAGSKTGAGLNILLLTDPVHGYFDVKAEPPSPNCRVMTEEELHSSGFDYVGLGYGEHFAELYDEAGWLFGVQSGALTAQSTLLSGPCVAVFGEFDRNPGAKKQCQVRPQDFEMRRIYAVACEISGLTSKDAADEIVQLLKDEGARVQEDIVYVELEGRYGPYTSPSAIVDEIKQNFSHAVSVDNTRPDYLTGTYAEESPEARFIEAMLVLKRKTEKKEGVKAAVKPLDAESTPPSQTESGRWLLSGRIVEDALYYGLDALGQKQVSLRNVD
jgi:DNA repair exonuclease SbcCD nuclease subunit